MASIKLEHSYSVQSRPLKVANFALTLETSSNCTVISDDSGDQPKAGDATKEEDIGNDDGTGMVDIPEQNPQTTHDVSNSCVTETADGGGIEIGSQIPPAPHSHPLTKPLDAEQVFAIIRQAKLEVTTIPMGLKSDVYFIVDNTDNMNRRAHGKRAKYVDDCGAWDTRKGSLKRDSYVVSNSRLKNIKRKDGAYGRFTKKEFVPSDPQPNENDIVVLRRYYCGLKGESRYRRKVTWADKLPSNVDAQQCNVAVVEYIGKQPQKQVTHGNARKTTQPYMRTATKTRDQIKSGLDGNKPWDVYERLVWDDSFNAPCDLKQVQNLKQTASKQSRGDEHRQNAADELQHLLSLVQSHPYVQAVHTLKGKPPLVILYTEQQLRDLRNFCCSTDGRSPSSVLGVDRTFNLGKCFVTLTVYKHKFLRRKGQDYAPIMLGPLFLHWDGDFRTYHTFFAHLQGQLGATLSSAEVGMNDEMLIGSDEEKALTKAIRTQTPR